MTSISKKTQVLILLSVITASLTLALSYFGVFQRVEWITYDARMKYHRADKQLHPQVAVVLIDEASLQAMDNLVGRWPWPRSVYADLLEFFAAGGARAVAFDILFSERQNGGTVSHDDQRFAETSLQTGLAYQAMQVMRETAGESQALDRSLPEGFVNRHAWLNATQIKDIGNNSYLLPFTELAHAAAGVGIVEVEPDYDSVYRRVRLLRQYQGAAFPAMSIAPLYDRTVPVTQNQDKLTIGDLTVPLDGKGRYLINMVGSYAPYSIAGIFDAISKMKAGNIEDMRVFPDEFENKIVFVGASAIGLQDVKTTPISSKTPGVLLHASVATNILEHDFLHPVSEGLIAFFVLLFTFATLYAMLHLHRLWEQSIIPVLLATLYAAFSWWQFGQNQVYEMTAPLFAILLSMINGITYIAFTEGKDKRRVRNMLGQYVSPAVLAEVIDHHAGELSAEVGHRENLSILFSDVRGFTSISEALPAEKVVELLNIHFSVMTDIIFEQEGTLDKFIGDALMAFWGAPIRVADHADRAVLAALKMERGIELVNAELAAKELPPIRIGIGINTGEVILGNIGSQRKLDYTVIGDGVNLASRLEGLTKQYHCQLLITENTYHTLKSPMPCAIVDMVRVKGKHEPIRIYMPLAHLGEEADALTRAREAAELTEKAFDCYTKRQWDEALAYYAELASLPYSEIFVTRCNEYKITPPPESWDGVYTLTTK